MKASEFCKFFDFTYEKEHGYADTDYFTGEYNYKATDDHGCWNDRFVTNLEDFADEFDACLPDYIQDVIEEDGFEEPNNENYWSAALKWINNREDKEYYKIIREVIECLLDPKKIVEG